MRQQCATQGETHSYTDEQPPQDLAPLLSSGFACLLVGLLAAGIVGGQAWLTGHRMYSPWRGSQGHQLPIARALLFSLSSGS